MIGWYIHHHGYGHLARAAAVTAHLREPVTALTSLPTPPQPTFDGWVTLERDDGAEPHPDPTAHGRLHWVPLHHRGLATRSRQIVEWIERNQPRVMVVDVSVEVTVLARLCGVPVIVVAGPGERDDAAHQLAYDVAERILAAWPRDVYDPAFLQRHAHKATYVGAFSRFDRAPRPHETDDTAVVLSGGGGTTLTLADVDAAQAAVPALRWTGVGLPGQPWSADIWTRLSRASVVVTHGGQNALADVAAAARPAVVVPQQRPFAEQTTVAAALQAARIATSRPDWPTTAAWPAVVEEAIELGGHAWSRWSTGSGAQHAASVIEAPIIESSVIESSVIESSVIEVTGRGEG